MYSTSIFTTIINIYIYFNLFSRSQALSPELQVCTSLRFYAQGGFLSSISDLHGISPRAASKCIHNVSEAICNRVDNFISWPNEEDMITEKQRFHAYTNGFPCIVGLVDGTHIPILAPAGPDEAVFVNRKGYHSINTHIICNSSLKIYNINCRYPGSTHDSFIFRNSPVWESFENGEIPNSYILGDSGYPLTKWLLTPYLTPTTPGEIRYNSKHKRARSAVERCIGMLKMRFRCLTKPLMFRPERCSKIIVATACLHNYALSNNINLVEEEYIHEEENGQNQHPMQANIDAQNARQDLVRRVFNN